MKKQKKEKIADKNKGYNEGVTRCKPPMHRAFRAGYTSRTIFFSFFLSIFVNVAQHLHFAFRVLYDFFRGRAPQLPATRRIYVHNSPICIYLYEHTHIYIYTPIYIQCKRRFGRGVLCIWPDLNLNFLKWNRRLRSCLLHDFWARGPILICNQRFASRSDLMPSFVLEDQAAYIRTSYPVTSELLFGIV